MRGLKYSLLLFVFCSSAAFAIDTDGDGYDDSVDLFPNDINEWIDTDLDGIGNNSDPDIDGDGLDNAVDNNDDGDLALDIYDPLPNDPSEWLDTDNDGLGNNADTDDDNDGVPDLLDVFPLDPLESLDSDNDGLGNNDDPDDDTNVVTGEGDGVLDVYDQFPLDPLETIDTDLDGIGNNADLDDDGDGVNDGDDAFPLDFNVNADLDNDGIGNSQDPDIDGDTYSNTLDVWPYDPTEWFDTDSNGVGNNTDTDDDGDGILDINDDLPLDPTESVDTDNDGIGNIADDDDDGDGAQDAIDACPLDPLERLDTDGDGTCDGPDTDADNDTVLDVADAFPLDNTEQLDTDGDGIGDNSDADKDGDGITNVNDAFDLDATEYIDTDGDGVGNNADLDDDGDVAVGGLPDATDAFPLDPLEWEDTDGDGLGNRFSDSDDDDDGILDIDDSDPLNPLENRDTDGDGISNNADPDDDDDNVLDGLDDFPFDPLEWEDNDGDGIGNNADPDDDNDGHPDFDLNGNPVDAFPFDPTEWLDTDGDGQGDQIDADSDADGFNDSEDLYPLNPNEHADNDGDGIGDNSDSDDDNDGFSDVVDAFPTNSSEWFDTDNDNIGNNTDIDDDDDGRYDNIDLFPLDENEWFDSDNDGIGDNADSDDDNDGTRDVDDAFPFDRTEWLDTDGDGLGNTFDNDDDNDGVLDFYDDLPLNAGELLDTDGDLVGNNTDLDDDNDGMSDEYELEFNFDPLDAADGTQDTDLDGIINADEAQANTNPLFDDYAPVIAQPQAVNIDAEHIYTMLDLDELVSLTEVSVSDGKDGDDCCNLSALGFETGAKNVTSGLYPVTWRAVDDAGNIATVEQTINVHPLVNFSAQRKVAEGGTARIEVVLSGLAPNYPLEIPFVISGDVDEADYQVASDKIVITEGTSGYIDVLLNNDFDTEGQEEFIITLDESVNGGSNSSQIINIVEENVAPEISVIMEQDDSINNQIAINDGEVTLILTIDDSNVEDTHVIDWQLPDYLSAEISANQLEVYINPLNISLPSENKGLIEISVNVIDSGNTNNSGSEPLSQLKHFSYPVVEYLARLSTTDSDRDGITDVEEGYSDEDHDGLPAFLDVSTIAYVQPLHVNSSVIKLAETEPGLKLQLGKYAVLQLSDGLQLSQQEIEATGLITPDTLEHRGGYYDFEIHNILPFGRSVAIVLPLSQAIAQHSVYRKYSAENNWENFLENSKNTISSSKAVNGVCPPPESSLYGAGLIVGNVCLRLIIEDGGPNDNDGIANGVVDDPGGIAVEANSTIVKDIAPEKSSSGSISLFLLLSLLLIGYMRVFSYKAR